MNIIWPPKTGNLVKLISKCLTRYGVRFTKKHKLLSLVNFFLFGLIILNLALPTRAEAFSTQQVFSSASSLLTTVGQKIQYVFAFTPASKVKVLEAQAQRKLTVAQTNPDKAEGSIKQYQDIKNRQSALLDKIDDDTLKQVQEQTLEEQQTLAKIGNDQPNTADAVKTVNTTVVTGVKNVITLKEGTTAGEAFEQTATISYAPGTSGQGTGGLIIEGGELQKMAPGTSGTGQGGQTIQGGESQFAPGTSGDGGTGTQTVVGE